jgi:hypothetical protein
MGCFGPCNGAQVFLGVPHDFPLQPDPTMKLFCHNESQPNPKYDDGKTLAKVPLLSKITIFTNIFFKGRDHVFPQSFCSISWEKARKWQSKFCFFDGDGPK